MANLQKRVPNKCRCCKPDCRHSPVLAEFRMDALIIRDGVARRTGTQGSITLALLGEHPLFYAFTATCDSETADGGVSRGAVSSGAFEVEGRRTDVGGHAGTKSLGK